MRVLRVVPLGLTNTHVDYLPTPLIRVVGLTPELEVRDCRRPVVGIRTDVVELDERTLVAAVTVGAHERTTAEVAHEYRALDLGGDMP